MQNIFGYQRYLYFFSIFKIYTIKWDKNERDFLLFLKLIKENNGVIIDIGANIGIMSVLIAKNKPNCKIISYEPIPSNISVFKKIIRKFQLKNVELIEKALGNFKGSVKMILPKINKVYFQGLSYVIKDTETNIPGDTFEVEITKLDDLNFSAKLLAIKIDVENYEFEVLEGSINTINSQTPIIYCELWDNINRIKSIELLEGLDYLSYCFVSKKLEKFNPLVHKTQNFIFIHKNHLIKL